MVKPGVDPSRSSIVAYYAELPSNLTTMVMRLQTLARDIWGQLFGRKLSKRSTQQ